MGASHRQEALGLLDLVSRGVDTPASILALVRVPERQRQFLDAWVLRERECIETEFLKLLRAPARLKRTPTPAPVQPIQQAILEALTELMAAPAPVQILHTLKRRGVYRKRRPPEDFASRVISIVAEHFKISVAALITPGRGPIKGSGLPRWTAVYLLREGGMLMREIVDVLGYCDNTPCYQALHTLAALRAKDPNLDRDIAMLLERNLPGPAQLN